MKFEEEEEREALINEATVGRERESGSYGEFKKK